MSIASDSVTQGTPYRIPWRALALGGVATVVICIVLMRWVDDPLATAMYGLRDTALVAIFRIVTLLANGAIWYTGAVLGMGYAWWLARTTPATESGAILQQRLRAGTFLIVSMAASGLLINGLKLLLGRDRPLAFIRDGIDIFHGPGQPLADSSFPSGHTQSIWAAMIGIAWIYPPARPLCVVVALLVSASRIIIDMHYASDVIAGMYLAWVISAALRAVFEHGGIPLTLTRPDDPLR